MAQNSNILQELQELGSSLVHMTGNKTYQVPEGYFESLADKVLSRIKSVEAGEVAEELLLLSPVLSSISKQTPYSIPSGYFDNLEKGILLSIKQNAEIQTAKEELENISPFLGSLKKEMPYQVPEGYFQDLGPRLSDKTEKDKSTTKLVSITGRKWFMYAAAAMITGIIAMTVLLISTNSNQLSEKEILAKFTKEVKKLDDNQQDKLADFMDAGFDGTEMVKLSPDKPNEVKDLLKGISEEELKDFQEQNEDLKDVLLTTDYNE